ERIEAMLVLRKLHMEYGHIQEIIIQNFRSKPGTKMSEAPEPELNELLWTIAIARIIFGPEMSIQAPPNLSPGVLPKIIDAGINDWGGVSPVTPDFVNPEAPWPHLETLAQETEISGKYLQERLTLYPDFILNYSKWLDSGLHTRALRMIDTEGYPRTDDWVPGKGSVPPSQDIRMLSSDISITQVSKDVRDIVAQAIQGELLSEKQVIRLFQVRGPEFTYVCKQANKMRSETIGDTVTYVVNRNINNTNVCYFKCQFCAFSKGKTSESLRDTPYDLENSEIARRAKEAWDRGATEVCVQGGINPDYTGQTYLDILSAIRKVVPNMHIHAFSPLEVWQGAKTQGLNIKEFLAQLKQAGLNSLPGTAAEILDDEVRAVLCPDKINTAQWLEVMETAHGLGFGSTATIMFGHIERLEHWARHLIRVRDLQCRTGGFTEFVPLPFVHMQAPIYLKGRSRVGPTFRESVLMHAVSRLVFNSHIKNIQTSWVKMGEGGVLVCLESGANDLGGTLMNESITRAAGSEHGQEKKPQQMERLLRNLDRSSRQRNTLYGVVSSERRKTALTAEELLIVTNTPLHFDSKKKVGKNALVRSVVDLKSSSNVLSVSMEET
ncbi:MAG: 5-amino-6-(D-ribitylamino)uracil--L-tyrosine 4-hydroxyphenyl transferase CofH, partial [Pseudomonadales bacterium]|nr:5-amino-6-(D-ribitylamino)uracil--L-tyrosine 4-hydroxyphenyl transferase CofH [Pseudomonadales bacterium]